MKIKNAAMFIMAFLVTISPGVLASIEGMPDIDTFNWNIGDDFSDLNYSLNNWDLDIPSDIQFGINADDEYGYLKAGYLDSSVAGEVVPVQSNDIIGIRADIRLTELSTWYSPSYYVMGFDLFPDTQTSLYWGIRATGGGLTGKLMLRQNGVTSFISGTADFSAAMRQTYNLAMVFDDTVDKYYLYLNGEKMTDVYFPDAETSFSSAHFRMYNEVAHAKFEFDNIEFATVPEPTTILLLSLGGLLIRKR